MRTGWIRRAALVFLLVLLLLPLSSVVASPALAPGDLDTSFGTGGKVTTDFGGDERGLSLAIQSDGRIVVAGYTAADSYSYGDFALARYNGDGTLDTSFGTGGKVTTDFGTVADGGRSVIIHSDGRIVVAGSSWTGGSYGDFALARYNTDGTLDTSFGIGGKVTTNFGDADNAWSVAIQSDGRIVVAGHFLASAFNYDFAVACYNANGSLDASFGVGGKVTTDLEGVDYILDIAIQSDGRIVVAGYSEGHGPYNNFAVARYNANGNLDTTFGVGGKVTTDFGGDDGGGSVAIQGDGRIVVAGRVAGPGGPGNFALARYNADGTLDTSFGTGGKVTTDFGGDDGGGSVAIQGDGRIVVGGRSAAVGGPGDFALARYNATGSLDTSFGTGGKVTANFGGDEGGGSVAIQSDGSIVVAGYSNAGGTYDFAVARYLAAEPAPTPIEKVLEKPLVSTLTSPSPYVRATVFYRPGDDSTYEVLEVRFSSQNVSLGLVEFGIYPHEQYFPPLPPSPGTANWMTIFFTRGEERTFSVNLIVNRHDVMTLSFGGVADGAVYFGVNPAVPLLKLSADLIRNAWPVITTFEPEVPVSEASAGNLAAQLARLGSPAELQVYDPELRVTGFVDGQPTEEIPNSMIIDYSIVILVPLGSHTYAVVGTGDGDYQLAVASVVNGEVTYFTASELPIESAAVHAYTFDWEALSQGDEGATIQIDSEGDGSFERSITANSDLTRDEFVQQATPPVIPTISRWGLVIMALLLSVFGYLRLRRRRVNPNL